MDKILKQLQGKAFNLCDEAFNFLSDIRKNLLESSIPPLTITTGDEDSIKQLINQHREQFNTSEYIQSRIDNPTSGTIDHIHCEVTAKNAVNIASMFEVNNEYAVELLRAAGHLHDCERSFPNITIYGEESARKSVKKYEKYKKLHAMNSANTALILINDLKINDVQFVPGFSEDLCYLIERHELGGETKNNKLLVKPSSVDTTINLCLLNNILTDADSISYLDANILTNWDESNKDPDILAAKVRYMYSRMTKEGKEYIHSAIIESDTHVLGKNVPEQNDLITIRNILLRECSI